MKGNVGLPVLLVLVLALSRWPGLMPPNFSAIYALVFCSAVYLPGRWSWAVPLATCLISDLALGFYYSAKMGTNAFDLSIAANYLAYGGMVLMARRFNARHSTGSLVGGGLASAILFYIITNTAAWLQLPDYAKNLAGWIQALTVGTPGWPHTWEFFRNTLLGSGLFTGLFVGAMKLSARLEEEETEEENVADEPAVPPADEAEA